MVTLSSIFDAFGSPDGFGKAIGKNAMHARAMRRRGSIPVRYWPKLISAAKKSGAKWITYEALTLAHVRPAVAHPSGQNEERRAS